MSTTHEYDAYCDTQDALKREGAKEALERVRLRMLRMERYNTFSKEAIEMLDRTLCYLDMEIRQLNKKGGAA